MTFLQKLGLLLIVLGFLALALRRWQATYRPRLRHPAPRSKRTDESFQATNDTAKLLTEVLALRKRSAQWPEILKIINPLDEPRIRTVLLELRWPHVADPDLVLKAIEEVCLSVNRNAQSPTRVDLLELSKVYIGKVQRYGS